MRRLSPLLLLALAACVQVKPAPKEDVFFLRPSSFNVLPSWATDDHAAALAAFEKSCARIAKKPAGETFGYAGVAGTYGDWQPICAKLPAVNARAFFEENFSVYDVHGNKGRDGLFTGYYEPSLPSGPDAKVPLYAKPKDMITVNLGDFKTSLKGETITGRVEGDKFIPYHTREEIEAGALEGKADIVAHVDDPVDAFFLQIQGSGQVMEEDGSVKHVGYAAQNGHAYFAIGKDLVDRGILTKENVSMQTIREWLAKNPGEAQELMNKNKSYVFFTPLDGGVKGGEGVVLTPGRSLAVDRKKIPYGTPVFVDADPPAPGDAPVERLMIAQDTGGAITGAVRGDYFWGPGDIAAEKAGVMKSKGQMWILLPKTVTVPEKFLKQKKLNEYNP